MQEIWKDIKGYEGLYQVSNLGRVKSILCWCGNGKTKIWKEKEKILSNCVDNNGYIRVVLFKECKGKNVRVHRLVAEAFIPNLEDKRVVNHINGIKTDNRVENLEWCTYGENAKHAWNNGLNSVSQNVIDSAKKRFSKKVNQYTKEGVFVKQWESITEARKTLEIEHIGDCCLGKNKSAGGYVWKYA